MYFFSFLVMETMLSQTSHAKTHSELMQAARKAFSGNDPGQKKGPLAKMGFDLALLREEYLDHEPYKRLLLLNLVILCYMFLIIELL